MRLAPGGLEPRIVNGNLTSDYPSVAALVTPANPATAQTLCSATLIGCQTVLTAAHCVCNGNGGSCQSGLGAPNPGNYGVFLQHGGFFAVSSIAVHPSYSDDVADVAVLKLAAPVTGIRPSAINATASPGFGTPGVIVGYGRSGGANVDYGLKRFGAVETLSCAFGLSNTASVCWEFDNPLGPPGTDSNTCNGDSGGPLFADLGDGDVIAGTTSGGVNASCNPFDHSYDANVFTYAAYIQTQGGADLANTACGDGAQVGDPGAPVTAFEGSLSASVTSQLHSFPVVAAADRVRVTLNGSEVGGNNFDLYVKYGTPPTTSDYDCKADGTSQYGACDVVTPAVGTWWILVRRSAGSGQYQVTATTFLSGCSAATEGLPCNDGNACTTGDTCTAGTCSGAAVADDTPCDDGRLCTPVDRCLAGVCTGSEEPRAVCKQPLAAGASSLALRDASNAAGDTLTWSWRRGAQTSTVELGDPTAGDPIAFCLYDESAGAASLALEIEVVAPALWKAIGSGFRYRDPKRQNAGVDSILLRAAPAGLASATFRARGSSLGLPPLPLHQESTVTAQLVGPSVCLGASYSTNQANAGGRFRARSDP